MFAAGMDIYNMIPAMKVELADLLVIHLMLKL